MSATAPGGTNGLVSMLDALVRANLERDPRRVRLLGRGVVELVARDAGVSAVIDMSANPPRVSAGPTAAADVRVSASSDELLALAGAPLRLGCPDPLRPDGRAVLGAVLGGRVRIAGLLRHPLLVLGLARLLSAD